MNAREALERAESYLDEATENLTFDEFEWALEEVWRGVAWALNALLEVPLEDLGLGPKGQVPAAGTLSSWLARVSDPPAEARVVAQLEGLRACDPGQLDASRIEAAVFAAWEMFNACGLRLRVADDRLEGRLMLAEASPGRVGSPVLRRRTALKLIAAGSVFPLKACQKVERDNRPVASGAEERVGASAKPRVEAPAAARVKRVEALRGMQWPTTDPFLFCAYHVDDYPAGDGNMGPAASLEGRHLGRDFEGRDNWRMYHGRTIPGFPRHPHRGFETVTVVRSGMLDHSDSMGATARYGQGDVQWLTAGGGIQHAEMFPLLRADAPNPLELYQIWLNLPRRDKMADPHFKMLWSEQIPRVLEEDAQGRAVELTLSAGAYGEHRPPAPPPSSWASRQESDLAIWTLRMQAGARFELPAVQRGTVRSLYVHRGAGVTIAGREVGNDHMARVEDAGALVVINGAQESEILLLQGRPIGEPVARRGPFVMNTQDEIRQAYADYRRTQFGGWPWAANDPVHEREEGRFAIQPDGRREEPT